jgi:putative flippase GtrA
MAPQSRLIDRMLTAWHQRGAALKAVSFGMIGVINTAIDASVFFLALATLTSSLIAANVLAWLVAVSCSYVMNSFITFARESGRELRWRDYASFVASGIAGMIANTATLVIIAQVLPVWAAKGCAIIVSFLVNFSLSHFVVFRKRERPASDSR